MTSNTDPRTDGGEQMNSQDDSPPDPSELDSLSKDAAVYQTDEHGDLLPQAHAVETIDGWRQVKIYPTPKGQAMEFEQKYSGRSDLDPEELDEILNDKVAQPDLDWSDPNIKPGVYMPVMMKVLETMMGEVPDNDFHREVQQELQERQNEGN